MTQQNEGGRDGSSSQANQGESSVGQQLQGVAGKLSADKDRIVDTARSAVASAKDSVLHARDEGAALLSDARASASESYRSARDYALEEAQVLSERARRAGYASADYARRAGASTGEFVTQNALPLTLIGAGIGWLAWSLRKQRASNIEFEGDLFEDDFDRGLELEDGIAGDYPIRARRGALADDDLGQAESRFQGLVGSARDAAGSAKQRVGELAGRVSDSAGEWAERATQGAEAVRTRVGETASHLTEQASELSHEARERLRVASLRTRDFADENPLIVGAIAVAAGVGIGLLLPNTQPENRLLGETRDRLLGDARGLIGDARGIIDDARETARDAAGQLGRTARETAQDIRNQVSDSRISH
jgi:ElaB/YqjD/DUF883 family membrane-anchored ribosome-binding protein